MTLRRRPGVMFKTVCSLELGVVVVVCPPKVVVVGVPGMLAVVTDDGVIKPFPKADVLRRKRA